MFFRKSGVLLSVVSILSAAVSCGPSAYLLDIETRQPSASGINLIGKTVSVVYADKGESEDSLFSAAMSSAFASVLEDDQETVLSVRVDLPGKVCGLLPHCRGKYFCFSVKNPFAKCG